MRKYYYYHNKEVVIGIMEIWADDNPAHDVVEITNERNGKRFLVYERYSGRSFLISSQEYLRARDNGLIL